MKHYFFSHLVDIKRKINKLASNLDDIDCLMDIQKDLLGWHLWLENTVRIRKARLAKLKKAKRARENSKEKTPTSLYITQKNVKTT